MNVRKPQLSDELKRIPKAAKVIAALVPICVIAFVLVMASFRARSATPGPGREGPTVAALLLTFLPLLISVVFAIWVLLVGYVYADAGRRGMNRLLWMLVVIFVPNALGFILYFLLRYPVATECPGCGRSLSEDVGYCPHCGTQIAQSCPSCKRLVGLSDQFCSACGHNLKGVAGQPT